MNYFIHINFRVKKITPHNILIKQTHTVMLHNLCNTIITNCFTKKKKKVQKKIITFIYQVRIIRTVLK